MTTINLRNGTKIAMENSSLQSESGMATIETISLLVIFIMMMSYTFGAFGIIHTGILNSIAARTYAFETMRNRSNVIYFRDVPSDFFRHYQNIGSRIHAIRSEADTSSVQFPATERAMQMGLGGTADVSRVKEVHMQKVPAIVDGKRNSLVEVNPAWIITQYGICVNAKCRN